MTEQIMLIFHEVSTMSFFKSLAQNNMEVDGVDGVEDCEDWLVQKTHNAVNEKDLYEAKCWLFTAKCLYPLNFKVQVSPIFKTAMSQWLYKNTS